MEVQNQVRPSQAILLHYAARIELISKYDSSTGLNVQHSAHNTHAQ